MQLLAALSPAIQLRKYPIGKGRFRCAMLARPLNNTGSNTLDAPTPAPAHPSALQTGASLETGDHTLQLVRPRDAFTRRALDCEHIIKRYIFSGTALTLVKCDLAVAARAASLVASFNAAVRTAAGVGEESEAGDGGIVGSAVDLAKSAPQPWQLTPAPFANEAAAGMAVNSGICIHTLHSFALEADHANSTRTFLHTFSVLFNEPVPQALVAVAPLVPKQ